MMNTVPKKWPEPERILVIETLYLGDLIHTLPLIQALRKRYPAAQLDVLVRAAHVSLMQQVPGIDQVLAMDPKLHRGLGGLLALCGQLRARHYDLVLNPGASDRATALTAFSGGKWRIGRLNRNQSKRLWPLLHDVVIDQPWGAEPMYWQKLAAFVPPLGLTTEIAFGLAFDDIVLPVPLASGTYIHISPFASEDRRSLTAATLVELVVSLRKALPDISIVISCGPSAREKSRLAPALAPLTAIQRITVLHGSATLNQLGAIIQSAALHIGPDSGPLHIAMALRRPTIGCFLYKNASAEWLPVGCQHQVVGVTTPFEGGLYGLSIPDLTTRVQGLMENTRKA